MPLSKVVPGQKITASLFNELIDGVNNTNQSGNGNTSFSSNDTSVIQYPPDWVNNYNDEEIHSWRPKNIWVKKGPLEILDPIVNVYNSIKTCELDDECDTIDHNITGQWYCGVRKDELGENLKSDVLAAFTQKYIYTNKLDTYKSVGQESVRITSVYSFQEVFKIFQNQTKTDPSIYTYQNLIPVFNDSSPGDSGSGFKSFFDYSKEKVEGSDSYIYKIIRNTFYTDLTETTLNDFTIPQKDCTVYLRITKTVTSSGIDYSYDMTTSTPTTGEFCIKLWGIKDWEPEYDYRTSIITIFKDVDGGGGGGSGVVLYIARGPFEPVYSGNPGTAITGLRNCVFQWERRFLDMGQQTLSLPSSTCWLILEITHPTAPNPGADVWPTAYRIRIETSDPFGNQNGLLLNADDTITLIPLYKVGSTGIIEEDYRAVPVAPVYR